MRGSVATCRAGRGPHSAARTSQQGRACPSPRGGPQNPVALRDRSAPHPTPPPAPYPHPGSPEPRRRPRSKSRHSHRPRTPPPSGDPGGPDPEAEGQEDRRGEGRPTRAPPRGPGTAAGVRRAGRAVNARGEGDHRPHDDVTPTTRHTTPHPTQEPGEGGCGRFGGLQGRVCSHPRPKLTG